MRCVAAIICSGGITINKREKPSFTSMKAVFHRVLGVNMGGQIVDKKSTVSALARGDHAPA
jgi:hypothetical protein